MRASIVVISLAALAFGLSGCIPAINPNAGYNYFASGTLKGINYGNGTTNNLNYPRGMAVDSSGDIFVVDGGNNRIVEITAPTPITNTTTWKFFPNSLTPSADHFYAPEGIAVDSSGNIWVSDTGYNRGNLPPNGRIVHLVATGATGWQTSTPTFDVNNSVTIASTTYNFIYPLGLAVNSTGTMLYITDPGSNFPSNTPSVYAITVSGSSFVGYATTSAFASGATHATYPRGIAVDSNYVYITDETNYRIIEMNSTLSNVLATLGTRGSGTGQFISPQTIALDSSNIYVVDSANYWVVKMTNISGAGWTRYGVQTGTPATSVYPNWITVSSSNIYVSDDTTYQIAEFQ
jgi:hypothetical protein